MWGLSPDYFDFEGYLHAVVWYSNKGNKEVLSGLDGLCVHCVSSPSLYLSVCSMISSIIVPRAPYENWNTFYGEPEALMVLVNVLMVCTLIYTINNMFSHSSKECFDHASVWTTSRLLHHAWLSGLTYRLTAHPPSYFSYQWPQVQ